MISSLFKKVRARGGLLIFAILARWGLGGGVDRTWARENVCNFSGVFEETRSKQQWTTGNEKASHQLCVMLLPFFFLFSTCLSGEVDQLRFLSYCPLNNCKKHSDEFTRTAAQTNEFSCPVASSITVDQISITHCSLATALLFSSSSYCTESVALLYSRCPVFTFSCGHHYSSRFDLFTLNIFNSIWMIVHSVL